jgi:hypothetical protein
MAERTVKVSLVIDDKGSVKVMRQAGDESSRTEGKLKHLDKGVKELGKSFGGLKGMIGLGLGSLGAGGLVFGLKDIASKTSEIAAETEKFHTITGIGASSSLAYSQALKARGLSGESVTKAFGLLSKNIKSAELQEHSFAVTREKSAAKGRIATGMLGRQASAFKELGINLTGFNKLAEQGKLEKITKSFEAMAPGMKKTRLERELFGRGGNTLSTVLEKNNLGLTHQIDLVKKFFPTVKGGANAMNELLEKQAESKMAWEGLEFTIGQKLIPVMTEVMGWFSKLAVSIEKGHGIWGTLERDIEKVIHVSESIFGWFKENKWAVEGLTVAMQLLIPLFAFEKVAKFASALKGLAIVSGISKLLGVGGFATAAGEASAAASAAGGGIGATMLAFAPEIAAFTFVLVGFYEAYKHLKEIGQFFHKNIFGTNPVEYSYKTGAPRKQARLAPAITGPLGIWGEQYRNYAHDTAISPREREAGQRSIIESISRERHITEGAAAAAIIHLHLDSLKVAEAILRNPRARRTIAEGTATHAQGMTARK